MKGVVLLGDSELTVRDFPDPVPSRGEVLVRTRAAAICGSDIHLFHSPRKWREGRPQVIAGHEPAGVVEATGEGVTLVKPGDRVTVYHYIGCGKCMHCLSGMRQWCPETRGLGVGAHGADADFVLVREDNCYVLPDSLSFVDGVFMACAAGTAYSAMKKLQPNGSLVLAVIGLGPVGLSGVLVARAMGAKVLAIGRRRIRLDLARELGADFIVDADDPEAAAIISGLFPAGVDLVFETSGAPDAYRLMLKILKKGGRACVVAGHGGGDSIGSSQIVGKELTIMGSFVLPIWMVPEMAAFIAAHELHFDRIVTHRFTIDQAEEAFRVFDSGECGKVIFEWKEEAG